MSEKLSTARFNGVSIAAVRTALDAIETPDRCWVRARNRWLDGGRTRTTVKDLCRTVAESSARVTPLVFDSAALATGERGIDPLEQLLAAVGSSFTTTLVLHAAMQGIHVQAVDTWLEGDVDLPAVLGLDESRQSGFVEVRLKVKLEAEACEAQLDELVGLAMRHSPVLDTVSRGTRVTVRRERGAR